jgi:hypothetical protein
MIEFMREAKFAVEKNNFYYPIGDGGNSEKKYFP